MERVSLRTHPGGTLDVITLRFDPTDGGLENFERFDVRCPDLLARAVPKRRAEYLAGRRVALEALREIGAVVHDLSITPSRAPAWPEGFTGSITHCDGLAAAVALRCIGVRGVGLDVERVGSPDAVEAIRRVALLTAEEKALAKLAVRFGLAAAVTIAFSAKESFYKATSASVGRVFDFSAVRIVGSSLSDGLLEARVTELLAPDLVQGLRIRLGFSFIDTDVVITSFIW